ncbi:hypothetical protein ABMA28_011614 [Loxostege sticticalis]|uniref:C2H2-type domain-containing protein n=1 Tax=Loxostege sticticalis TaxID=481309 RepID=A0ABD0S5T9_LOXSC
MEKLQDSSQELLIESHSIAIKLEPCNSNSESNETKKKKCKQSTMDQDMVNMFASVWVKVEVDEDGSNTENVMEDAPRRKKHKLPAKFKCDQCEYTTAYRNCLKLHVIGHDGRKAFSCNDCDYTTKYPTALNRHMLVKHQSNGNQPATMYRCDECDYTTFYKWNLNAHNHKHKNEKQYKCPQCDYSTAFKQHYNKHYKRHSKDDNNMVYKCDQCPFVTRFDGHITRHLAKIHNIVSDKANKCDFCDFSTKVNWRLTIHKTRSKQEELLKCSYCGFETFYMCQSKMHRKLHFRELYKDTSKNFTQQKDRQENENDTSQVGTDEKSEEIEQSDSLKESESNEKTEKYILDPKCEQWNYICVLESDDKDRPFKCVVCDYTARFKASVQRHYQRRHTGPQDRPYKCVNCDFSTKTKDQIGLHNKRSQSNKIIKCTQCTFSTKYKCQFAMHTKTHYDQKCPNCDFKCRNKYEMQKHFTIIHLGDGLKCQYCDFQATRKESLLSHESIHTGEKPFKCNVPSCEYMTVRKSMLRNHIRRCHGHIQDDVTIVSENKIQSLKLSVDDISRHNFEASNLLLAQSLSHGDRDLI